MSLAVWLVERGETMFSKGLKRLRGFGYRVGVACGAAVFNDLY